MYTYVRMFQCVGFVYCQSVYMFELLLVNVCYYYCNYYFYYYFYYYYLLYY